MDESIFRAYDIRGIYPGQIDEAMAKKLAQAYAVVIKPEGEVVVGYDVRVHSKAMAGAVTEGLVQSGVKVVNIGLASTDMNYFAIGNYGLGGGIQVTASHNPAEWHGMKMTGAGVRPFTGEKEITAIKEAVKVGVMEDKPGGMVRTMNVLDDYADFMLKYLGNIKLKPMKIAINPNFGFAGKAFARIVQRGSLPIEIVAINDEPDGTFPKGPPDPLLPKNRVEFVELVKSSGADLGVTWDADADRVFFCADGGFFVEPYYVNTLLIADILEKNPGQNFVVYDPRYTWALIDTTERHGGVAVPSKVGHSYIKATMRKVGAIFGAESSGHTYYKDFWFADCGMLPVMQLLGIIEKSGKKLSELVRGVVEKYPSSGEINRRVADKDVVIEAVKEKYQGWEQSVLDGLTVEGDVFRFNIRPSNNEPLFRLNLEARTPELVKEKVEEVLAIIGGTEA